jgi:hypothetical protein
MDRQTSRKIDKWLDRWKSFLAWLQERWVLSARHNDIQHNDTQHNDIQHNDTQHNDIQHTDTQHKADHCYAECHLC